MQLTHETIGIIAGVLALVGYVPYIYATIKGETKPNKASWIIWTVVGGLLALSYFAEGDRNAIWLPLGYFLGPLIVAILSFKYGYSEWSRLDKYCLVAAVLSVIPWVFSNNASLTLLINVVIDSTGAIPTIVKTYHEPETEDFTAWLIFFAANTIQLFAVSSWDLSIVYLIYLFLLAGSIVALILRGKWLKRCSINKV